MAHFVSHTVQINTILESFSLIIKDLRQGTKGGSYYKKTEVQSLIKIKSHVNRIRSCSINCCYCITFILPG